LVQRRNTPLQCAKFRRCDATFSRLRSYTYMMIQRMIPLLALLASPVAAEIVPMDFSPMEDGPWIELPEGAAFNTAPPTYDDIIAMSDLDGDPSVTTAKEHEMIALLSQVLGASPITN
jgi:hypothetical protein